jgi:hypothetical protein
MGDVRRHRWWLGLWPFERLEHSRLRRERIAIAKRQQGTGLLHDPIEDDPTLRSVLEEAQLLAEADEPPRGLGSCHRLWRAKKRVLKNQFEIDWFSPAEMNPGIRFD